MGRVWSACIQHESTSQEQLQSHSNPLHRIAFPPSLLLSIASTLSPLIFHKKWPEQNKHPAKQLGVRPLAFNFQQSYNVYKPYVIKPLKLSSKLNVQSVNTWQMGEE
jgi:hypothetical protein